MKIRANGIHIEVEDTAEINPQDGDAYTRPVVLLIMGLGMQLVAWPPQLVQALVDAGFRVIRMDNRDIGLSQHFDHLGKPNILWAGLKFKMGLPVRPPYSLEDMAKDALGVLDALEVDRAHIVGVSMGGMIAQRVAIAAPQRVLSLTSIMSSSGARGLPEARRDVLRVLLKRPASSEPQAVVDHYVRLFTAIGSPGYPVPESDMRERVLRGVERSFHPVGSLRQMVAIISDNTRAEQLARIKSPTLVLHGRADPLVPFAHGEDTAKRITGARLVGFDGMGHDLPPEPVALMLDELIPHIQAAEPPASYLAT
ncbi:MAG: alpha/beta fold hydrolase [Burkholderiaceae bacterium]|jgi:pimeloyl-ACP methyl ester carboxylesterase|nr:alpha/beta fold hydrolase [Burkholderiaceae bacterium]